MEGLSKEIVKQAEGVLTEAYKDALSPSVKPIGTILSFFPRTIRLAFGRWEKWIINGEESIELTAELLRKRVEQIPEEKICEPEPYVAIPAIQQISYCENSADLRELYANLLASSMNTDKKWKVHPAFVDIIKQLNPDEAKILKKLPPNIMMSHPLIDVIMNTKKTTGGYHTLVRNFSIFGIENIENPGNICSYIDNLERLKLIEIPALTSLANKNAYTPLKEHPIVRNSFQGKISEYFTIDYKEKSFNITSFGVSFIDTCCK